MRKRLTKNQRVACQRMWDAIYRDRLRRKRETRNDMLNHVLCDMQINLSRKIWKGELDWQINIK